MAEAAVRAALAGGPLVRRVRVPLLPPPLASPLLARVRCLGPAPLQMGQLATLEIAFSLQVSRA
jgi:hypothetical protein